MHDIKNCPINSDQLKISKGIEVGHIFYFGTKYSEKLGAFVQNSEGKKVPVHMGSYGIGVSRLVGAIIEAFHDEKGVKWPFNVAPFKVSIINLNDQVINNVQEFSDNFYKILINNKVDVLYDDRDCSIGKKLSDNELIGSPYQLIIGKRDIAQKLVELRNRITGEVNKYSSEEVINFLLAQIKQSYNDF